MYSLLIVALLLTPTRNAFPTNTAGNNVVVKPPYKTHLRDHENNTQEESLLDPDEWDGHDIPAVMTQSVEQKKTEEIDNTQSMSLHYSDRSNAPTIRDTREKQRVGNPYSPGSSSLPSKPTLWYQDWKHGTPEYARLLKYQAELRKLIPNYENPDHWDGLTTYDQIGWVLRSIDYVNIGHESKKKRNWTKADDMHLRDRIRKYDPDYEHKWEFTYWPPETREAYVERLEQDAIKIKARARPEETFPDKFRLEQELLFLTYQVGVMKEYNKIKEKAKPPVSVGEQPLLYGQTSKPREKLLAAQDWNFADVRKLASSDQEEPSTQMSEQESLPDMNGAEEISTLFPSEQSSELQIHVPNTRSSHEQAGEDSTVPETLFANNVARNADDMMTSKNNIRLKTRKIWNSIRKRFTRYKQKLLTK